jgi:23S rRNA pseudouridine2605 synthase
LEEHELGTESGERLQKVLAAAGIASRRECEQLILEGRVEVDRQVVTALGTRVDPQRQEIRVDGEALPRPKLLYFAVNKPEGVVSTSRDPSGRPRVIDLLPPNTPRVYCVGRLDISSEGLILVTNDGELANGLTHPRHGVEKIYHVQVAGQVERDVLAQLHRGMHLAEGFAQAKHVRVKSRRKRSTILEMVLDEGRNREIRRLLARVGHKVQRLRRIAVGPVRLGELPTGAVRALTKNEIQLLHRAVVHGRSPIDDRRPAIGDAPKRSGRKVIHKGHKGHKGNKGNRTVIR